MLFFVSRVQDGLSSQLYRTEPVQRHSVTLRMSRLYLFISMMSQASLGVPYISSNANHIFTLGPFTLLNSNTGISSAVVSDTAIWLARVYYGNRGSTVCRSFRNVIEFYGVEALELRLTSTLEGQVVLSFV